MNQPLILAIDQGTTSSRAVVFDTSAQVLASAQQEFTQQFPADGWVEHDANEIWSSVLSTCTEVIKKTRAQGKIAAVGITNQRETTVVWNRRTAQPIHNAIVWQDRRTADLCRELRDADYEKQISRHTGLLADPYFSGTKIRWLLDHVQGARAAAEAGDLAFGTIDSFLIYKLTEGAEHATDVTNASRTMLFNIHSLEWDPEMLEMLDVPRSVLPEVRNCDDTFGFASALFTDKVPITGVLGDQHAATVGQACFAPGMLKSTYGTGNFVMLNTGSKALESEHKLLTTIAYRLNGETSYALEGSVFIAGAVIQWLRDKLHIIANASDSEAIARDAELSDVVVVPAFTGLGAPHWDAEARGAIYGLTRNSGFEQIVTAALESVCFQSRDLLNAMRADGAQVENLRVDGGLAANNWAMQRLADLLDLPVQRPINVETTVLGAAVVAGLGAGLIDSLTESGEIWQLEREFTAQMNPATRDRRLELWDTAIARTRFHTDSGH
ncbi:MAG: glycerol kinase GlpK [Gammaproteobacteria bacterium]|nr:glycerol kinase GlpK [Gammaproteobacteria bacterium]